MPLSAAAQVPNLVAGCLTVALVLASATLFIPPPAAAEPPPGPAAALYDADTVARIDLGLPGDSLEALEADPTEYVPGTLALEAGGIDRGPLEVGIRLKGSLGSFRSLDGKAAFKVKLDEYVDGQTVLGLEKLTLNNMVQDDSMVHETLAYELFRSLGVPAPRTGYATVAVNGEDYGLYLNVETLDAVSLPRWFASTRHLYEGGYETDVLPGATAEFEVDEGKSVDRADLEALISAANDEGDFSESMEPVADLDEMVLAWAVERYIGHWDGYAGGLFGRQPNNYYLHGDDSGRFSTLPWGTDQTWEVRLGFGIEAGLLLNRCLADESCTAAYREALRRVRAGVAALGLGERTATLAATLAPWQEADPRREQSIAEIAEAVGRSRAFIAARPGDLAAWLGESDRTPSAAGQPVQPGAVVPTSPRAGGRALRVGRTHASPRTLITEVESLASGDLEQRAVARLDGRRRRVCFAYRPVAASSLAELRCQLSAAARSRLREGPLRIALRTCLAPPGGAPQCVAVERHFVVPPAR